jgi:hypothetical protein
MTTSLTLVRPRVSEPPPPPSLQLARRTLAALSHCSSNLKDLSESISLAVSRMNSPSCSSKGKGF